MLLDVDAAQGSSLLRYSGASGAAEPRRGARGGLFGCFPAGNDPRGPTSCGSSAPVTLDSIPSAGAPLPFDLTAGNGVHVEAAGAWGWSPNSSPPSSLRSQGMDPALLPLWIGGETHPLGWSRLLPQLGEPQGWVKASASLMLPRCWGEPKVLMGGGERAGSGTSGSRCQWP